jgi:hypothetical protein
VSGWCQIAPPDPAATNKCMENQMRPIWYTLLVSELTLNKESEHLSANDLTSPTQWRQPNAKR